MLFETKDECLEMAREIIEEYVKEAEGPNIPVDNNLFLAELEVSVEDLIMKTEEILQTVIDITEEDLFKITTVEYYYNLLLGHYGFK